MAGVVDADFILPDARLKPLTRTSTAGARAAHGRIVADHTAGDGRRSGARQKAAIGKQVTQFRMILSRSL